MSEYVEHQIIVQSTGGMQLSEGSIRENMRQVYGHLPALLPCIGTSVEEVRRSLEQKAKDYYGYDVEVEIIQDVTLAV